MMDDFEIGWIRKNLGPILREELRMAGKPLSALTAEEEAARANLKSSAYRELLRAVGEGVGTASMCWENVSGAGVFDSGQALTVLDEIMDAVMIYAATANLNDSVPEKARKHVFRYVKTHLEKTDSHITFGLDGVYVVWSCKVLQNWKCLVSTNLPDGMYYEVTFDGDQDAVYIDAYKKFDNIRIAQGEDSHGH
jgi:hypothetical protein